MKAAAYAFRSLVFACVLAAGVAGCGSDDGKLRSSKSTAGAANHMEEVFANADAKMKKNAEIAYKAMRAHKYKKALYAIQTIKQSPKVSFDQGVAVNDSLINLERDLIYAMEDGDENAKKAYQLLRRINRN